VVVVADQHSILLDRVTTGLMLQQDVGLHRTQTIKDVSLRTQKKQEQKSKLDPDARADADELKAEHRSREVIRRVKYPTHGVSRA
jgi:hypothetical protein